MKNTCKLASVLSVLFALIALAPAAHAESTATVSIHLISNSAVARPGTTISFAAGSSGFINPQYTFTDAYSGEGRTLGTIDSVGGYFSWTPTVYDAGTHLITVTATDAFDHTASNTITLYVQSDAVLIKNLAPGTTLAYDRTLTFSLVAPGYTQPYYIVYDSFWDSDVSPAAVDASSNFSWTPDVSQQGLHSLRIDVNDLSGHRTSIQQDVMVTNPIVSIAQLPGPSRAETPVTFAALATGLANPTTFSLEDSFDGVSTIAPSNIANTGAFSWTPTTDDIGVHTLSITATDAFGNSAATSTELTIIEAPASPTSTEATGAPTTPDVAAEASPASASPESTTAPSTTYLFSTKISLGTNGKTVIELQRRLTAMGLYAGPITGTYWTKTAAALKKFQAANGIPTTGIVGPLTRAVLNR